MLKSFAEAGIEELFYSEGNANKIQSIIKKIPNKYKTHGMCDKFAQSLVNNLEKERIEYKIIRIDSDFGIFSDKANESIGEGYHYGVQIDNIVYDNSTIEGMVLDDWLRDLGLNQGLPGISWKYTLSITNRK